MQTRIESILQREAEAILRIPTDNPYAEAVSLICERIHQRHGKLITSGMGKAGQIAMNIATTFCSTGTPSIYLHPSEAQHGDLGVIQPNDLLLVISNSAKTREILELVTLARRLHPSLPVIAITGNPDSDLGSQVNYCLATGNPPEVCHLGLAPTTSTTMMTVIGDILVVLTTEQIGFTKVDYALRHHGGYLGKISRGEAADPV